MKKNWEYSELSKKAKAAGGPEQYVEMLETVSRAAGRKDMYPWIGFAIISTALVTTAIIKGIDLYKKKNIYQEKINTLKKEIVNELNNMGYNSKSKNDDNLNEANYS